MVKKWWFWVGIAVAIFIVWQIVTGAALSSKLWKMVRDQIVTDQNRVVEVQAENQKWYEDTIKTLNDKIAVANARLAAADRTIGAKDAEIDKLRRERESVVTSSDPSAIVDDLHRLGYSTEYRRRK